MVETTSHNAKRLSISDCRESRDGWLITTRLVIQLFKLLLEAKAFVGIFSIPCACSYAYYCHFNNSDIRNHRPMFLSCTNITTSPAPPY